MKMKMNAPLVPCYPLSAVLTPEQLEVLKPYMRTTFQRTWDALGRSPSGHQAYRALHDASRVGHELRGVWSWRTEGDSVEAALYAKAKASGAEAVMARGRR